MPLSAPFKRPSPHRKWRAASAWLMHSSTVCVSKYMDAQCVRAAVLGVRITQYITLVHIPAGICGHASQRVARMHWWVSIMLSNCWGPVVFAERRSGCQARLPDVTAVKWWGSQWRMTKNRQQTVDIHAHVCMHVCETPHALHAAGLILK